jgi:hypothetical protein
MKTGKKGLDLIKSFEGFKPKAYRTLEEQDKLFKQRPKVTNYH